MTGSATTQTYRYVADGRLVVDFRRRLLIRLSVLAVVMLCVALVSGLASSLNTYSDSWAYYPGRVLWIGVVWGLIWFVLFVAPVAAIAVPLYLLQRRRLTRLFGAGTVTEVGLGPNSLV